MKGKWVMVTGVVLIKASTDLIVHGYIEDVWIRSSQFHISVQESMKVISHPAGWNSRCLIGVLLLGVTVSFKI